MQGKSWYICVYFLCFIVDISSATNQVEQEDETKLLWRYVSKLRKTTSGGNFEFKCNICEFNGSYTRVKDHLVKISTIGVRVCSKVSPSRLVEFKKLDNEISLKIQKSQKKVSLYLQSLMKAKRQTLVLIQKSKAL